MPEYPNSGMLFREAKKTKLTSPDYKGQATLDCPHCARTIEVRLSGWVKIARTGVKFLSLSFRPKAVEPGDKASAADEPLPF
jgi:hypothetical protein